MNKLKQILVDLLRSKITIDTEEIKIQELIKSENNEHGIKILHIK